jgi:hypothetical protein
MSLLISLTDFATKKVRVFPTNFKFTESGLEYKCQDAQDLYVKCALGSELMEALEAYTGSPEEERFEDLLNGKTYEYGGVKYSFKGLKDVICRFAMALYIPESDIFETNFGSVNKNSDYSVKESGSQKAMRINNYQQQADKGLREVIFFLSVFADDYPEFNNIDQFKHTVKLKAIGD